MADTQPVIYGGVLLKAKAIMDFIGASPTPPTLTEISIGIDINKTTVLKILRTLELCDYVHCYGRSKCYYLGTVFLDYAQATLSHMSIATAAKPFLTQLRDQTNETVNLGVLERDQAVLVDKLETPSDIKLFSTIGKGLNLYSSAMGKALLSTFTPEQLTDYLNRTPLRPITPHTLVSATALRADIANTQARGYALEDCENQSDVVCIGFPLVAHQRVYGTFSISVPKYRIDDDKLTTFIHAGKTAQQAIISAL
ncbi:MAG: IclR family transcriptional regulator [Lactobacillus sp.]|jgi:DNA-binding IclR family transcriptional regulator|nr:IclR family transcriptional regulator [Lactobacillus sp.]MCI2031854.1 IclR family transcriptional regulator [Lactobacillus sp.]